MEIIFHDPVTKNRRRKSDCHHKSPRKAAKYVKPQRVRLAYKLRLCVLAILASWRKNYQANQKRKTHELAYNVAQIMHRIHVKLYPTLLAGCFACFI